MAKKEWSNETLSTLKIGNRVWRAQVVTSPTGAEFLGLKAFKPKADGGAPQPGLSGGAICSTQTSSQIEHLLRLGWPSKRSGQSSRITTSPGLSTSGT